jgi:uncharacterized protein YndB with AHSA1/START domain
MLIHPSIPADKRVAVITRTYDAPRTLVWDAFTRPEHLMQWWGPHGFEAPRAEADLRVGGVIEIDMRGPDGFAATSHGLIREVDPPRKLVLTNTAFPDGDGNPQLEVLQTITFEESGGRTTLTVRAEVIRATEALVPGVLGMHEGWSQSLDKLGTYLARVR